MKRIQYGALLYLDDMDNHKGIARTQQADGHLKSLLSVTGLIYCK